MTSIKEIRGLLQDWIEDTSIDDVFLNYINYAIRECEATVNFSELYDEKVITPDSDGIIIDPPLAREIGAIYPDVSSGYPNFRFTFRHQEIDRENGGVLVYSIQPYPPFPNNEAEYNVEISGTTLTQFSGLADDFFTADDIGKRIMIPGSSESHEMVSLDTSGGEGSYTAEITPEAEALVALTASTAILNPAGTKRYQLRDKANSVYTGDVKVCYQRKHPKVQADADLVLIPCPQSIALIALQQALITNKYNVDSERLTNAVFMAKNRELDCYNFRTHKDRGVNPMFAVRNMFKRT